MLKSFDVTELLLVDFLRSMILYTLYHVLNFVFPFSSFLLYVFTFRPCKLNIRFLVQTQMKRRQGTRLFFFFFLGGGGGGGGRGGGEGGEAG